MPYNGYLLVIMLNIDLTVWNIENENLLDMTLFQNNGTRYKINVF